jgi:hypothetical protein
MAARTGKQRLQTEDCSSGCPNRRKQCRFLFALANHQEELRKKPFAGELSVEQNQP